MVVVFKLLLIKSVYDTTSFYGGESRTSRDLRGARPKNSWFRRHSPSATPQVLNNKPSPANQV